MRPSRRKLLTGAIALIAAASLPHDADALLGGRRIAVLGGRPTPERFVATRGRVADGRAAGFGSLMARTAHWSRVPITKLKIAIPNWYVTANGAAEAGSGATGTYTASIEYPAGTFTQLLFSGSATGTVADAGDLWSDYLTITIPVNTQFWVRIYGRDLTNTLTTSLPGGAGNPVGDTFNASNSGNLTDQTMSGVLANSIPTLGFFPIAIVAPSKTALAFILFGDSISMGYQELTEGSQGDVGVVCRSAGAFYGYSSMAVAGSSANNFSTTTALRRQYLRYATHGINQLGTNDLANSRTAVQVLADHQTIYSYFTAAGLKALQTTLTPEAISTDAFVQQANEAPSFLNAARITVNTAIRGTIAPLRGFLEVAAALEPVLDDGIFIVDGGAAATATVTIATPGVVTRTAHGLLANAAQVFKTTGALPTGLVVNKTYYVKTVLDVDTFTLSATVGGAAINTTGSQSGVHTITTGHAAPDLNIAVDGVHPTTLGAVLVKNGQDPTIQAVFAQ